MNVVELRPGPSLADVAGQLRQLADRIERGEHGEAASALVLLPQDGDYPAVFGFGNVDRDHHPIVTLELAKTWFATTLIARS